MDDLTRVRLAAGIELDVWDTGPRDAPALLFLHGFPENHRTWRHQIAHLNDRFRCVAPDQRGYGNSSRPPGVEHYAVAPLAMDLAGLIGALGLRDTTVIGHDWGGALAWGLAAMGQASGMIARAIIANAPHPVSFQHLLYTDSAQRAASQYINVFRDTTLDPLIREHGLGAVLQQALKWEKRPTYDPAEQAMLLAQWADPDRAFAMLNWYRASGIDVPAADARLGLPEGYLRPPFPVIDIPTLVIWGMDDEAILPANLDSFADLVSDLTIARIEGAGHFVPWEAPDAVNAAIDGFLARTG